MRAIRRILVPTDFTACADEALLYALHVAMHRGAELHLLHIAVKRDQGSEAVQFSHMQTYYERVVEAVVRSINTTLPEEAQTGVKVRYITQQAKVVDTDILAYAAAHEIDLIVMGTQGGGDLKSLFIGRVARNVVRMANCPVLTVRPNVRQRPEVVGRILVPLDFSEHALHALDYAKQIALHYRSTLDVCHVFENELHAYGQKASRRITKAMQVAEQEARVALRRCVDILDITVPEVRYHVVWGFPQYEIPVFAERHRIDLIVLGSHGLSDVASATVGSVAEQVVHLAGCPVLTVKCDASFLPDPHRIVAERPQSREPSAVLSAQSERCMEALERGKPKVLA